MPNVSPQAAEATTARGTHPIVVGFSARALAEAVNAWGARPVVIDHFTDQDCRELSFAWYQIVNWGDKTVPAWLEQLDLLHQPGVAPWVLLGGGTENWPELLTALRRYFTVLGPSNEQLQLLRDHQFWRAAVAATNIGFPESLAFPPPTSLEGQHQVLSDFGLANPVTRGSASAVSWLRKPTRGAGGFSIQAWPADSVHAAEANSPASSVIYQRRLAGRSLGVHCILTPAEIVLMGCTESLVRQDWPGPSEFIYRGSWGPLWLAEEQADQIKRLCRNIQSATGCVGWLQLDFIQEPLGQLWLLELNPRWAAGMEILLLAGINPVEYHLEAWQSSMATGTTSGVARDATAALKAPLPSATAQYGKAVVYVERAVPLTGDKLEQLHALPRANYVDLPALELRDKIIAAGQPLLTVRTRCVAGLDEPTTRERLLDQLARLRATVLDILGSQ